MESISLALLAQIIVNGLISSSIYILMALGFNMIFGIMNIVNFAHGDFYMIGAFVVFEVVEVMKLNYFLGLLLALVSIGILGMICEKFLFKPIRKEEGSDLVVSIAIGLILQSIALLIWGPEDLGISTAYTRIVSLGLVSLPMERIIITASTVVLLVLFYLFIKFTKIGQSLRAVAQDSEVAALQGVNVETVFTLSFGIGCSLAAVAGSLISPLFSISPYIGGLAVLKAFVIVVLGGLGSIPGSLLGGLVLGLGESFFSTFLGGVISDILGFVAILVLLIVRPTGLLGTK